MSESERYIDFKKKKISLGADGNALVALVCINAVIFLILTFVKIIYFITQSGGAAFKSDVEPWFSLSGSLNSLPGKPWTLFAYMFTHTGVISAISNMLWLWVFGSIFQNIAGPKKLIPVYIYGGIAGALLFMGSYSLIFPIRSQADFDLLQGASPAIMAVAVAITALSPDFRFFRMLNGGIPLWVITLVYVIIDFAGISGKPMSHNIAHLGGGLTGFLFVVSLRKGYDWSLWMINFYSWFLNLFTPKKKAQPVKKIKERVFYKTGNTRPFVKKSHITQQRIDEILDKINQKGYHSLTEEEKGILKRAAEIDL